MPVPTSITQLDTVADNNSPPGLETAKGTVDNYLRAHAAFIAQTRDAIETNQDFVEALLGTSTDKATARGVFGALSNGSGAVTSTNMSDSAVPDKIHAATSKTTPVDADELGLVDSAASNGLKKLTWANLKAAIKSYFESVGLVVTASVGIGYGSGAGGAIAQSTNKATAVTLNKPSGQITTSTAALAASTTVSFTVNNSLVGTGDVVGVSWVGGTDYSNYTISTRAVSGGFVVYIRNISAGTLSEALAFNFTLIKGATS